MSRSTTITLAFALTAASLAPTASAANTYSGFFRPAGGASQSVHTGMLFSQVNPTVSTEEANGRRATDIEGYRNSNGDIRYDMAFEQGTGDQEVAWGMNQSTLVTRIGNELAQGRHPTALSSWYDKFGGRRYAAVFRPKTGGFDYKIGETFPEYEATFIANIALGLWPTLSETYLDADGTRLWDTVYGDKSGGFKVLTNMSETAFQNIIASEAAAGRNVAWFEQYRTKNLSMRYTAMFNTTVPPSTFYLNQDEATFLATYQSEEAAGNNLLDMSSLVVVTNASWENYGTGLAGTNSVPDLSLSEDPNIGQNIEVNIGNSRGAPTLCVFFTGLSATSIPLLGGEFLVNPLTQFSFIIPAGGVALPVAMPTDPALDGFELYNQVVQEDPGAVFGVSISRGMKMTFGRLE